jgi:hypothetical protein
VKVKYSLAERQEEIFHKKPQKPTSKNVTLKKQKVLA